MIDFVHSIIQSCVEDTARYYYRHISLHSCSMAVDRGGGLGGALAPLIFEKVNNTYIYFFNIMG